MTTDSFSPPRHGSAVDDGDVGSDAVEQFVRRHPWMLRYARVGWAAKGVVYLLTGVLAFIVATRDNGDAGSDGAASNEADPSGAIAKIAEQPFGTALLWAMATGLLVYATWRLITVALPADLDAHSVLRRIGYLVSALTYIALAITAVSLARRAGSSQSQDSRVSDATADVMSWTGGRWIVGLVGLVVIGVGAYFLWKGVSASFEKELEHRSVGPFSWRAVQAMGRVGWIGRAAMMALIGVFVVRAAWRFDPDEARGLDDSLRRVADTSVGMALVFVVAVGLVLYGVFCVISAPARKLVATDEDTVAQ